MVFLLRRAKSYSSIGLHIVVLVRATHVNNVEAHYANRYEVKYRLVVDFDSCNVNAS